MTDAKILNHTCYEAVMGDVRVDRHGKLQLLKRPGFSEGDAWRNQS